MYKPKNKIKSKRARGIRKQLDKEQSSQVTTWYPNRKISNKITPAKMEGELILELHQIFKYYRYNKGNLLKYNLFYNDNGWKLLKQFIWPNWSEITSIIGKYINYQNNNIYN